MPKVTYSPTKGLVQETGTGINLASDSIVLGSLPSTNVQAITTTGTTITSPGAYTVSGVSAALTTTVPNPSSIPGGVLVVRAVGTGRAHILTGSASVAGVDIFAGTPGAIPDNKGQKITFPATTGASVSLISDGLSYCIMASSGSMTIGA